MTLRRVALAAAILLVPSVIVGVVVHRSRSAGPSSAPTSPADALTVTARLEPYRSVVFTGPLDPSAAPPATTCRSAMSAMQSLGGSPVFVGRLVITIQATRAVQLRIDKVTVLTVRREDVELKAAATCAGSEPTPGSLEFDESFFFGPDTFDHPPPVVRLADQFATAAPPRAVDFSDPTPIDGKTFDFRPGAPGDIPIYLLTSGGPTFRTGLQVAVDVTVNGLARHQVLADGAEPFWIYESGFRQGDGPIRQWVAATRTWQSL